VIDGIAKKDQVLPEDGVKGHEGLHVHPGQLKQEMPEMLEFRVSLGTVGPGCLSYHANARLDNMVQHSQEGERGFGLRDA